MKTTKYITASIALVGLLGAATAEAKIGPGPARPPHTAILPRPDVHHRTQFFLSIGGRPHLTPRIMPWPTVVVPRPAPIVVPAPVVIAPATLTVWITNGNGSRSPVVLKIDGPWYIGPRGERYASLPNEDQLRPIYGLDCGPAEAEEVSVYIYTDLGTLRRITLTRTANGYRGPNGELYSTMPTDEQLRMAYGR